jgi:hypothetical protein
MKVVFEDNLTKDADLVGPAIFWQRGIVFKGT